MKQPKYLKTTFTNYAINRVIGQGGNGYVYEAVDDNEITVAIKVLDPARISKEKLKRFKNEYMFSATNKHPNIINVFDHGLTDDGIPFFVMAIYENSIRKLIGSLSSDKVFGVVTSILNGVEAAHLLGTVHRDLKPENILFSNSGKEVVITDFGIASFGEADLYTAVETKDGTRLANFQYASPEQRIRGGDVTQASDIYSLGLMINELFTQQLPLGKNHQTIGSVSPDYAYMDIVVDRMLQHNALDRYSNIDEIKKEISARGKEQLASQRISELKKLVVPKYEVGDQITQDPMKIINVDWDNTRLSIVLNHNPNPNWIWALRNMGNYSSLMGKSPDEFQIYGNKAVISARENEVKDIIDYFKVWLPKANLVYEQKLKQEADARERQEINELKKKINDEEERKRVLSSIEY